MLICLLAAGCTVLASPMEELRKNVIRPWYAWSKNPPQSKLSDKIKPELRDRKRAAHIKALKKFAPHILEEYYAIDRMFNLPDGTYLDMVVFGIKYPKPAVERTVPHECTSWVVMPDLTGGKSLYLHKNRDSSSKYLIAQQRAVKGKHSWIGMGNYGLLGTNMGINDCAVTVAMNSGDRSTGICDAGIGTVTIARILLEESKTALDAVRLLEKMIAEKVYTHGKSGSIWFIADKESAFVVEHDAEHFAAKQVFSGMAIRANSWDFPEMLPYSLAKPNDIVGNNRREYAVRDLFFRQYNAVEKGVTPEMNAEASRIRELPEDKKCYPLCGVATNSAATFVIDQEFPQELSYAVFALGCPNYTLYLPIPLLLDNFPMELLDGTNPNAAMARWDAKKPLMSDDAVKAFEAKLNSRHRKAVSEARKIMRKNRNKKQAAEVLNKAFKENVAEFLAATK